MGGYIARQPNGKYCRFSTIVDCPTHVNMTFDDYVKVIMERGYQEWKAREEAEDVINNYLRSFEEIITDFIPNHMTQEEFDKIVNEMKDLNGKYRRT